MSDEHPIMSLSVQCKTDAEGDLARAAFQRLGQELANRGIKTTISMVVGSEIKPR